MALPLSSLVKDAINLHFELHSDPSLLFHSMHVFHRATAILKLLRSNNPLLPINEDFVLAGAILHDIGRTKVHDIRHGVVGSEIIHVHNFPSEIALIAERHIGGGIPRSEAIEMGLPPRDYLPESLEQKIVCYADKLVDYRFFRHNKNWWCIEKYHDFSNVENELRKLSNALGSTHPALSRLKSIEDYLFSLFTGKI